MTHTHPPSLRPKSFHTKTSNMPPNGSSCNANPHQSPRLTLLLRRAIIKAALPEKPTTMENLGRERTIYRLVGVSSAACFRQIYDVIDDNTIGLEWLDTTLAEVSFQPDIRTYTLIKSVIDAALASCVILDDQGYVNTGMVPALERFASTHQPRLQIYQYPTFWHQNWPYHCQSRRLGSR